MRKEKFNKLLQEIHKGNINALEPIYREYYTKMIFTAEYILHNKSDAEDIASNVLVKIVSFAKKHPKPNIDNAGAYINAMVRNTAIDFINRKKKSVSVESLDTVVKEPSVADDWAGYIDLQNIVSTLSDQDQQIVQMYYFYDYKIKTIAKELNIPIGTIKWKLNQIRKKLNKKIKI